MARNPREAVDTTSDEVLSSRGLVTPSIRSSGSRRLARTMWHLLEPIHAVTYFSPEPISEFTDAGFRGFWMGYFAGRSAPLGAVGPEIVQALFYNFRGDRVARALPAAWQFGSVAGALRARRAGSVAALRRMLGPDYDKSALEEAGHLTMIAADSAPLAGRPLHAANRALEKPTDPLARLWEAATSLREHRGDGHVASLLHAGIGGREAHVLLSIDRNIPREVYRVARDFDDDEWSQCRDSLHARGLLDSTGVSATGRQVISDIDAVTDSRASEAFDSLSDSESVRLRELLVPITRAVVQSGEIPNESPMGLNLEDVERS